MRRRLSWELLHWPGWMHPVADATAAYRYNKTIAAATIGLIVTIVICIELMPVAS